MNTNGIPLSASSSNAGVSQGNSQSSAVSSPLNNVPLTQPAALPAIGADAADGLVPNAAPQDANDQFACLAQIVQERPLLKNALLAEKTLKEEALRALEVMKRERDEQAAMVNKKLAEVEAELSEAQRANKIQAKQLEQLTVDVSEAEERAEKAEATRDAAQKELAEEKAKAAGKVQIEETRSMEKKSLEEKLAALESQLKESEEANETLNDKISKMSFRIATAESARVSAEEQLGQEKQKNEQMNKSLEAINSELFRKSKAPQTQLTEHNEQQDERKLLDEKAKLVRKNELLSKALEEQESELAGHKQLISLLTTNVIKANAEVHRLKNQRPGDVVQRQQQIDERADRDLEDLDVVTTGVQAKHNRRGNEPMRRIGSEAEQDQPEDTLASGKDEPDEADIFKRLEHPRIKKMYEWIDDYTNEEKYKEAEGSSRHYLFDMEFETAKNAKREGVAPTQQHVRSVPGPKHLKRLSSLRGNTITSEEAEERYEQLVEEQEVQEKMGVIKFETWPDHVKRLKMLLVECSSFL